MTIHLECADELLSTTRAVRKRLDLTRPVPRDVILDCIRLAQQAPTGGNMQGWRWVVVTDVEKRRKLGEFYRAGADDYLPRLKAALEASGDEQTRRVYDSAAYLADHLKDVPVLVIPCLTGGPPPPGRARPIYASIFPAVWSFNLALRARGLGTVITHFHLHNEREAAELLGLPDDAVQTALLPVAYTLGQDFKPAVRPPPETITYFDSWGQT